MFDAIFGRSVKILKILAKVQCVLAFVLASMLCGAVHEMLKPFSRSEEHTSDSSHRLESRMPSSA